MPVYVLCPNLFRQWEAGPLPDRPAVLSALKANDFRRRVLLEGFESRSVPSAADETGFRPATVKEYLPNRVTLATPDGGAGFLVLTDVWFPGWTCTVDGRPAPIYRANFLFRAVELPPGPHVVEFVFAPASYAWGKTVSGWAVVVVAVLTLITVAVRSLPTRTAPKRETQLHAVAR